MNTYCPKEGVVIELTGEGENSELCFKATIASKEYEEEHQKSISWKDLGLNRSDGGEMRYVPGESGIEPFSDTIINFVDDLFAEGVIVRELDISDNEMLLCISHNYGIECEERMYDKYYQNSLNAIHKTINKMEIAY